MRRRNRSTRSLWTVINQEYETGRDQPLDIHPDDCYLVQRFEQAHLRL